MERPDGSYLGVPQGETVLVAGDLLILYSRANALMELDRRHRGAAGDAAHAAAVVEQARRIADEHPKGPAKQEPTGRQTRET